MAGLDSDWKRVELPAIVAENLLVLAELYAAAQLEQAKVIAVLDTIAGQFMAASVTIQPGQASEALYHWLKDSSNRISEVERRSHYLLAFGFAGGGVTGVAANDEFAELWMTFVTAVAQRAEPVVIAAKGRALARNLSQHGYGRVRMVAIEVRQIVQTVMTTLDLAEIQAAYAASDRWTLIARVIQLWLGGSVDLARARTLATTGSSVIRWLAGHHGELGSPSVALGELEGWCERWLAASPVLGADLRPRRRPVP
ncbi:hypothetical protein ACNOYE_09060 [Nannocystaceae bacterium ST9]